MVTGESRLIRPQLKFERDFTMIPNGWVRAGGGLSLRAIGLLTQLMSHDKNFSVTFRQLALDNAEGDHAVRSAVNELRAAGYLKVEQERDHGKIIGSVWVLCDPATTRANQLPIDVDHPQPGKPRVGKPRVAHPHVGERHAIEEQALEDLATAESSSSSTRARETESDLDHLWRVCPATRSSHEFADADAWCGRCSQARADGSLYDRNGVRLREAVPA